MSSAFYAVGGSGRLKSTHVCAIARGYNRRLYARCNLCGCKGTTNFPYMQIKEQKNLAFIEVRAGDS